jgi:hypothetical protein
MMLFLLVFLTTVLSILLTAAGTAAARPKPALVGGPRVITSSNRMIEFGHYGTAPVGESGCWGLAENTRA